MYTSWQQIFDCSKLCEGRRHVRIGVGVCSNELESVAFASSRNFTWGRSLERVPGNFF